MAKATIKIRKVGQFDQKDLDLFRRYINLFQSHNLSIKVEYSSKQTIKLKVV